MIAATRYHAVMVDPNDAGQGSDVGAKQGKWPLIVSISVALLASATSVGLYATERNQTQSDRAAVSRENKIQAYKLFIAQARLTGYALQDVLECQDAIDDLEPRVPGVTDNGAGAGPGQLPDRVGVPVCNGLGSGKEYGLPEMKATYERLHATWLDEYKKLAGPHEDMVRYANIAVTGEVEILYRALGSLTEYDDTRFGHYLAEIEGDFCGEVSPEC